MKITEYKTAKGDSADSLDKAVNALIAAGTPRMDAIKQVARRRGLSKRDVYDEMLKEK